MDQQNRCILCFLGGSYMKLGRHKEIVSHSCWYQILLTCSVTPPPTLGKQDLLGPPYLLCLKYNPAIEFSKP